MKRLLKLGLALSGSVLISACQMSKEDSVAAEASVTRHDQPGEAAEFYADKRLAPGMRRIPVERLLAAREQMKLMPQFSSNTLQQYSDEYDLAARAPDAVLAAWTELGPGNVGGRTRSIIFDPNTPTTMYAGGVGGGVWKTTNAGATWAPVSDTMANLAVVALAMDPTNSSVVYAGTGEGSFNVDAIRGAGIFRSSNAGGTWTQLASTANANFHFVNDLLVAPSNNQILVAATSTGIWVSTDGGTSFNQRSSRTNCLDLSVTTIGGTDTWLAACGNFAPTKVLRSTDTTNWPIVLGDDPLDSSAMGRTAVAIRGNRAYAIASSLVPGFNRMGDANGDYEDQLHAFFRSEDGGATWTATVRNDDPHHGNTMLLSGYFTCANLQLGIGQGWYDIAVAIDPADVNRVWVGGVNLFRSDDAGENWGRADNIHPDHHTLVFHPQFNGSSNQTLINGQDGGIYRTNNARAAVAMLPASPGTCTPADPVVSWGSLNNSYAVTQFYHGTAYPNGQTYFAGAQDNGIQRGTDVTGANAWVNLTCGDGGYTAVDPNDTNLMFAGCQNVDIRRSTNGGASFGNGDSGITASEGSIFIPPFAMDPNNSTRLWFGGARAWRTTNSAATWTSASTLFGSDRVTAIAIATGNSDLVLMAGRGGGSNRMYRTTSATTTTSATAWTSTPVSGYVAAVAFAPSNSTIAYAAISTFGQPHVLKSTDSGATWNSVNNNLPDVPALAVMVHPTDPNRVYVGTDIGVFVSTNGGSSWAAEITSFPNVSTEWLQIIGTGSAMELFAFTHGRGAHKLSLATGPGTLSFATTESDIWEGGSASIRVNRGQGSVGAVSVQYGTSPGTATAPGDYTTTNGTLNWADGDTAPKYINVPITLDANPETEQAFTVNLSSPGNGASLGSSTHTVTVRDVGVFPASCNFPAGFTTPGDGSLAWVIATDEIQEGGCSLRTPPAMANSTRARFEVSATFPAGNVTFQLKVSSEAGWDCFHFLVDGVRQNIGSNCNQVASGNPGISGEFGWAQISVPLTAGPHTLTWDYEKDTAATEGQDAAWVDALTLPGEAPQFGSKPPPDGTWGQAYSHQFFSSTEPAPTFALLSGSFPPGLNLSGDTLSGVPTQVGTFSGVVRATNGIGSADQAFAIDIVAALPGAPTITALIESDSSAVMTYNPPSSTGGASILDYSVVCNPGGITQIDTASPTTITGLSNGQLYTCTVSARNSAGDGPASASAQVTPTASPNYVFGDGFE